jgi:hypothetical protein
VTRGGGARGRFAATAIAVLALTRVASLGAQLAATSPAMLDRAVFAERLHTEVTTAAGNADRHRTVERTARYGMKARGDTLVVTADTAALAELSDNVPVTVDVDAVIGGRWYLVFDGRHVARVVDAPFVPQEVVDVSDFATAMDDFLPPLPPAIAIGAQLADSAHRSWKRLADSAGMQRYHWTAPHHGDSTFTTPDGVAVAVTTDVREESSAAWHLARGPIAWSRRIETTATTHFSGRTIRAVVDARVTVRRVQ